jgi:hypothetical protein
MARYGAQQALQALQWQSAAASSVEATTRLADSSSIGHAVMYRPAFPF